MPIPKGKVNIQKESPVRGGFGGSKYNFGEDETKWIQEQIDANGGAFSVPLETAKEIVGYTGEAQTQTFIINLNRKLRNRMKLPIKAGSAGNGKRVAFFKKPLEATEAVKDSVEDDEDEE